MKPLPTGVVSFLMSDVEASSAIWRKAEWSPMPAFAQLNAVIDEVVTAGNGIVIKARGEGDSHFVVFERASEAVVTSVALQRRIARTTWPHEPALAVRIAVHTGEPRRRDGDYFGSVVNETARLRSIGHGGQTLVSGVTAALSRHLVDEEIIVRSLGTFRIGTSANPKRCSRSGRRTFPIYFRRCEHWTLCHLRSRSSCVSMSSTQAVCSRPPATRRSPRPESDSRSPGEALLRPVRWLRPSGHRR